MDRKLLSWVFILCFFSFSAFCYEKQGTTVKGVGCDVVIILQIAIESDSEAADAAMIEAALTPCWSVICDLPCPEGSTGQCTMTATVIVKMWSELSDDDKPKFHHIHILPGTGTSSVDDVGIANKGSSTGGTWYRKEYSPQVYCHETMHLAGLPDRYRDCRPWRIEAGVDNCGDGKKCTPEQSLRGLCPSCDGFEDDVMGRDVRNAFDCTRNILEVIKLVKNPEFLSCPAQCCEKEHKTTVRPADSNDFHSGIIIDGGLGNYHFKDATDKQNFTGFNFSGGYNATKRINNRLYINGQVKLNYSSTSKAQTTTQTYPTDTSTSNSHTTYHLFMASIGANAEWLLPGNISAFLGPQVGFLLSDKYRYYGTTTEKQGGTSSVDPFGNNSFHNTTYKKNIQFGFNLGAMRKISVKKKAIKPYINIYLPVSNAIKIPETKNKLYEFNIGVLYLIK